LSTVGHREAFRAFARAAKRAGLRFMVIGGTYRDVAIRAASTRDIDVVLIDSPDVDAAAMQAAGFRRVRGARYAWRFDARGRSVDVEIAALASSTAPEGPFSIAYQHAESATIEGITVSVPRIDDYVVLKLIAAAADRRRRARDLADVQAALEAFADHSGVDLSVPAIRARLRDVYRVDAARLRDLVALLRQVPRPAIRRR
jgi:predicted nucleotidyltransferase